VSAFGAAAISRPGSAAWWPRQQVQRLDRVPHGARVEEVDQHPLARHAREIPRATSAGAPAGFDRRREEMNGQCDGSWWGCGRRAAWPPAAGHDNEDGDRDGAGDDGPGATGENTALDDEFPTDSEWVFRTVCQRDGCTIEMRREQQSGAYKNVTLKPDPGRAAVFSTETSGTTGCANDEESPTKQRYSLHLTAPTDVNGRATARRMDVYFTEVARGCSLSRVARGVVSWRGSRKG
jgi:hypothetical protein